MAKEVELKAGDLIKERPSMRVGRDADRISRVSNVPERVLYGDASPGQLGAPAPAAAFTAVRDRVHDVLNAYERGGEAALRALAEAGTAVQAPRTRVTGDLDADDAAQAAEHRDRARPLIETELRVRRLAAMREWQDRASRELEALTDRPPKAPTEKGSSGGRPREDRKDEARKLLLAMIRNAAEIAILETDRRDWKAVEHAARGAVRLCEETAVRVLGEALPEVVRPHLQVTHATFMLEGNTPRLREHLEALRRRYPGSASLAYWAARYHVMAGDYAAARVVVDAVRDNPAAQPARARAQIAREILPFFETHVITRPEETHPSLFYTYQRVFTSDATINQVASELEALKQAEVLEGQVKLRALEQAAEAAKAAGAAVAASAAAQMEVSAEHEEIRRNGISVWKFEDENGNPRVHQTGRGVRRAGTIGQNASLFLERRVREAEAEARRIVNSTTLLEVRRTAGIAALAIAALRLWDQANTEMQRGKYRQVGRTYADCQAAVLTYLRHRYAADTTIFPALYTLPMMQDGVYSELLRVLPLLVARRAAIAAHLRTRSMQVGLDALVYVDWVRPVVASAAYKIYSSGVHFVDAMMLRPEKIDEKVDAPLLMIALVFAPMGIADALRLRGDASGAAYEYSKLLDRQRQFQFLSNTVEVPYVMAMRAQATLERGDAEYKAAIPGAKPGTLTAVDTYRDIFTLFAITPGFSEYTRQMQVGVESLRANADSLLGKIDDVGVLSGVNLHALAGKEPVAGTPLAPVATPAQRQALATLGMQVPVAGITARTGTVPGAEPSRGPYEPLLAINTPPLGASNPLLWAVLAETHARLEQISAGLNYLGYRDDFVPPWRFQFLLDRGRYFAEHAKNAERDYLAFLNNAENEEFRQIGAAQSIVLEKSNIRIESARLDQSRSEAAAANIAKGLSDLTARNAAGRVARYLVFNTRAEALANDITAGSEFRIASATVMGAIGGAQSGGGLTNSAPLKLAETAAAGALFGLTLGPPGALVGAGIGAVIGGVSALISSSSAETERRSQLALAAEQRELELSNLRMAQGEAQASARVTKAQLDTAKRGVIVSTLQHAAALLRHDFAVENLAFVRERTLNAELWYRLALLVRGISQTYLRHAIEVAFLAEQAYEFEADRQINVIRFDYDTDETSGLLAGDFLLRDLDNLEHDLIVAHRTREQHVKYVVSLARDFPSALQQMRQTGSTVFTVPLEQLERRFPGLFNLRIGSVDLLPIALMDPTRFSVELTYMGAAQTRVRNVGSGLPGVNVISWVPDADVHFPVKLRVSEAQPVVYSGMTRGDEQAAFPFMTANQRNAFEGFGAAASWHLDMSMRENRVDPRSIADILLTLNVSGYHDPVLRSAVERAMPQRPQVLTQHLSARELAPDAFYDFAQTGVLRMPVTADVLTLNDQISALRNMGVTLIPSSRRAPIGQIAATYLVEFRVTSSLTLDKEKMTEIPQFTFVANALTLSASAVVRLGTQIQWDFGDGTVVDGTNGVATSHTYVRPGRYRVQLSAVRNQRLSTFAADVFVSRARQVVPPVNAFPILDALAGAPAGKLRVTCKAGGPTSPAVGCAWRLIGERTTQRGNTAAFDLAPGKYAVLFTASRNLTARIYSRQRYVPERQILLTGFQVATNREFDTAGTEVNVTQRNAFAAYLFDSSQDMPVFPVSLWNVEIRVSPTENAFLQGVTDTDDPVLLLDNFDDVVIAMEYETLATT